MNTFMFQFLCSKNSRHVHMSLLCERNGVRLTDASRGVGRVNLEALETRTAVSAGMVCTALLTVVLGTAFIDVCKGKDVAWGSP